MRAIFATAALGLVACVASAGDGSNATHAEAANQEAIQLAGRRNLAASIARFQDAVELAPAKPEYHNNLGVVLMRVGRMDDAKQRFVHSLVLSGMHNDDAESNLADLFAYTGANPRRSSVAAGLSQEAADRIAHLVKSRKESKKQGVPAQDSAETARLPTQTGAITSKTTDLKVESTHRAVSRLTANTTLRDAVWRKRFGSLRHRVRQLPRVPASEMHLPKHFRLMSGTAPFVITDLFRFWETRKQGHRSALRTVRALEAIAKERNGTPAQRAKLRRQLADARAAALAARRGSWPRSDPEAWATSYLDWNMTWLLSTLGQATGDYYPANLKLNGHPSIVTVTRAVQELIGASKPSYLQFNLASGHWFDAIAPRLGPMPWLFAEDDAWIDGCFGGAEADPDGAGFIAAQGNGSAAVWSSSDPSWSDYGFVGVPDASRGSSRLHGGGRQRGVASEHFMTSHWRMLLIGSRQAGMFNHKDTLQTLSYQLQLQGAKRWHLCSSANDAILGPAQKDFSTDTPTHPRVSLFRPDYTRLPELLQLDCFVDDVLEGEAVFYPREFWHETDNLFDFTVAITGTLAAKENTQHVMRQLRTSCEEAMDRGQARIGDTGWKPLDMIKPSADLCRHYERCAQWSEVAYATRSDNWEPVSSLNATAAWLLSPDGADMLAATARVRAAAEAEPGEVHVQADQNPARASRVWEWAGASRVNAREACEAGQGVAIRDMLRDRGRSRQLGDARRG